MFALEIFLVIFIASLTEAGLLADGLFSGRSRCPQLRVPNGRLRARSGNRVVRISCLFPYRLVQGNEIATCIGGEWDTPQPICARPGCVIPEGIDHGRINILESGARLDLECDIGYALDGPSSIYCTKDQEWNEELNDCKAHDHIYLSCDFESADERFCGWKNDMYNDIDWLADKVKLLLFSSNRHVPPGSSQYFSGSYISLDAGNLSPSSSGKLLSPQLPPTKNKQRCLTFSYKVMADDGRVRPSLIVSYGGIPHWSKVKGEGRASIGLYRLDFAAKIIIEGKGSMVAIDNMVITEGNSCLKSDGGGTCEDNCGKASFEYGCSCNWECHHNSNCCSDIRDYCPYIKTPEEIAMTYTTTTTTLKPVIRKKTATPIPLIKHTTAPASIPTSNVTYPPFPSTIPTLGPTIEPITITVSVPTTTTTTLKPTTSSTTTTPPSTTTTTTSKPSTSSTTTQSTTTTTTKPTTSSTTTPPSTTTTTTPRPSTSSTTTPPSTTTFKPSTSSTKTPSSTTTTSKPSIINATLVINSTKPEMPKPNISLPNVYKYVDVTSGPNKTILVIDINDTKTTTPSARINRISKNNYTNITSLINANNITHPDYKHNISSPKSQTDYAGPDTKTELNYTLFNKRMDAVDQWVAPQVKHNGEHNDKNTSFNTNFIWKCIALGIGLVTLMYTISFGKLCFKKSMRYRIDNNLDQSDGDTTSNLELITNDEL